MSPTGPDAWMSIGQEVFPARLERARAPQTCAWLERLGPLALDLIHARWSGQACWAPLAGVWPAGLALAEEQATARPAPGQILLYAGPRSEPELFIPYGPTRFASQAGRLAGNPVLTIEDGLGRLAELGGKILWGGAMRLRIALAAPRAANARPIIEEN